MLINLSSQIVLRGAFEPQPAACLCMCTCKDCRSHLAMVKFALQRQLLIRAPHFLPEFWTGFFTRNKTGDSRKLCRVRSWACIQLICIYPIGRWLFRCDQFSFLITVRTRADQLEVRFILAVKHDLGALLSISSRDEKRLSRFFRAL